MRRFASACAAVLIVATSCAGSSSQYELRVLRPLGGTIASLGADGQPDGRIHCGTAPADDACGPLRIDRTEAVRLTAVADREFAFEEWAADCAGAGACTVDCRAGCGVKRIVAAFAPTAVAGRR